MTDNTNKPIAWMTLTADGDPGMLFFDKAEALTYCDDVGPVALGEFSQFREQIDALTAERDGLRKSVDAYRHDAFQAQEMARTLKAERDEARAECERLRVGHARYEFVRTLNVPGFKALSDRNLRGEGRFDDLIDAAMQAGGEK